MQFHKGTMDGLEMPSQYDIRQEMSLLAVSEFVRQVRHMRRIVSLDRGARKYFHRAHTGRLDQDE